MMFFCIIRCRSAQTGMTIRKIGTPGAKAGTSSANVGTSSAKAATSHALAATSHALAGTPGTIAGTSNAQAGASCCDGGTKCCVEASPCCDVGNPSAERRIFNGMARKSYATLTRRIATQTNHSASHRTQLSALCIPQPTLHIPHSAPCTSALLFAHSSLFAYSQNFRRFLLNLTDYSVFNEYSCCQEPISTEG